MSDWFVVCPESEVRGGVWHRWFSEQCVAVGWAPSEWSMTGHSDHPGWTRVRNWLKSLQAGNRIIPYSRDSLVGPVGTVVRADVGDASWKPTVAAGAYEKNLSEPELGRRILVAWETKNMPPAGAVAQIPAGSGLRRTPPPAAIFPINDRQHLKQLLAILKNQSNWVVPFSGEVVRWSAAPSKRVSSGILRVVSSPSTLAQKQMELLSQLQGTTSDQFDAVIAWRPESKRALVNWSEDMKMWWYSERGENRWWNSFGLQKPASGDISTLRIGCEINIPYSGIDRRIAGVVLLGPDDEYFIGHRGNRFGGGRRGLTKALFWTHYSSDPVDVVDDEHQGTNERVSSVALVARLGDSNFPDQLSSFVRWLHDLKAGALSQENAENGTEDHAFAPEFEGQRNPGGRAGYVANVNHGRIVRHLYEQLGLHFDAYSLFNNRNLDLGVRDGETIKWLFEVKTEPSLSSVYTAIGQLKYYATGRRAPADAKLVAVLPSSIHDEVMRRIESLGIGVMRFDDDASGVHFHELDRVLQS